MERKRTQEREEREREQKREDGKKGSRREREERVRQLVIQKGETGLRGRCREMKRDRGRGWICREMVRKRVEMKRWWKDLTIETERVRVGDEWQMGNGTV